MFSFWFETISMPVVFRACARQLLAFWYAKSGTQNGTLAVERLLEFAQVDVAP